MGDDYDLLAGPPPLADYLRLREVAGLSPKTVDQGAGAISGSWSWCHAVHRPSGVPVAMGRVIGDGGWYFHVADMATSPDHQRHGLGHRVLDRLLADIEARAPVGAYVTLLADGPGRPLYARAGFVETAPGSVGMVLASR
jgi:GNAT superfamily N-acetyltransferase